MNKSDKQRILKLLDDLPDDCSLEDIQYHLYVMQLVQSRTIVANEGQLIPHEEVKRQMADWLAHLAVAGVRRDP